MDYICHKVSDLEVSFIFFLITLVFVFGRSMQITPFLSRFAGTIYLVAVDTPEKEQQRLAETVLNKAMSSWGYKFEQYMTSEFEYLHFVKVWNIPDF